MIISDENSKPVIVDDIEEKMTTKHFWVLQLEVDGEPDFMLHDLDILTEHTTPVHVLDINGHIIYVPTDWNILVYSDETGQLDIVEVHELSRKSYNVLMYKHARNSIDSGTVRVLDYIPQSRVKFPFINKKCMLCHHVGEDSWICIAPTDKYDKYLKNLLIGDLI